MSMRLWVVIIEDRHTDTEVEVWLDWVAAVERAREKAHELDRHNEYQEQIGDQLAPGMVMDGWTFHATTGDDGATVRVETTETKGPWPEGGIGG